MKTMQEFKHITALVFKALGLAMATAAVVLTLMKVASLETVTLLLGLGLFCLALDAMQKEEAHE